MREYKSPTFDAVIKLLTENGPATIAEIASVLNRHVRTIGRSVDEKLRKHPNLMHVTSWDVCTESGGKPSKVWAVGPGKNAPKPKSLTRSEISTRSYRRNKKKVLMKQKLRRSKGVLIKPNWFDSIKGF